MYSYLLELHGKMVGAGREVERFEPALQLVDLGGGGGWRNQHLPPTPNGTLVYLQQGICPARGKIVNAETPLANVSDSLVV